MLLPSPADVIGLTAHARGGGCASKMGAADLATVLASLPSRTDPNLLVGRETFDDAAVYKLSEELAIIQTVDFFAPIVDDPYLFGQIAAANALSDIYAMGGQPITAMNIVGFPAGSLPLSILTEILRGGQDKVHEAGASLVGGHTVLDDEVKYGISVTGKAHPAFLLTNAGAHSGDRLLLTKPIGTGILTTAARRGALPTELTDQLFSTMCTLNGAASRAALACGARCATDITGFGLLGHASHIARASKVTLVINSADVPVFEGTSEAWRSGNSTAGGRRNEQHANNFVQWNDASDEIRAILTDPQTSGGLLVALPSERVEQYVARVPYAVNIGHVIDAREVPIVVS